MENNSSSSNSYEAPSASPDKPDKITKEKASKKKSATSEQSTAQQKKQTEARIARSFDVLSIIERPKDVPEAEPAAPAEKSERPAPSTMPEQVTPTEKQEIEQQVARGHLQAIEAADSETTEQLEPATDFLQRVVDGTDAETAFREVAAEQGLSAADIEAALAEDSDQEPGLDAAPEDGHPFTEIPEDGPLEDGADVPLSGAQPASGGAGATGGPGRPRGSGGSQPPVPPVGSPHRGSAGAGRTPLPFAQQTVPAAAPNMLPSAANTYYQRRNNAGELLVVGIVGYLLGRRRGRIKTEKKLLPVQRKLEKQVKQLEASVTRKEQFLVAAAQRKTASTERPPAAGNQAKVLASPTAERLQSGRPETRLHMEKPVRAEHLGHMVVTAEAPVKIVERLKQPGNIREAFRAEHVKTMDRTQLLELSEKVLVEGASLRKIYESGLVGERQLRHLVSEYLQGKDIRNELRREMVEHEIDFERDPIMRDRVHSQPNSNGSGGSGISELVAAAGVTNDEADKALLRQVAADEKRQAAATKQREQRQRLVADTAMATAIVVLAVAVIILVTRG